MQVVILEDNRDRREAMHKRLSERMPYLKLQFFEAAQPMIEYLTANWQQNIVLIGLDHDLELLYGDDHQLIDPGTGMEVAEWLAQRAAPICPVLIHTSNSPAGNQMQDLIQAANWKTYRVRPYDDLERISSSYTHSASCNFAKLRCPASANH